MNQPQPALTMEVTHSQSRASGFSAKTKVNGARAKPIRVFSSSRVEPKCDYLKIIRRTLEPKRTLLKIRLRFRDEKSFFERGVSKRDRLS
jgi:hypothetical protein